MNIYIYIFIFICKDRKQIDRCIFSSASSHLQWAPFAPGMGRYRLYRQWHTLTTHCVFGGSRHSSDGLGPLILRQLRAREKIETAETTGRTLQTSDGGGHHGACIASSTLNWYQIQESWHQVTMIVIYIYIALYICIYVCLIHIYIYNHLYIFAYIHMYIYFFCF